MKTNRIVSAFAAAWGQMVAGAALCQAEQRRPRGMGKPAGVGQARKASGSTPARVKRNAEKRRNRVKNRRAQARAGGGK